MYIHVYVYTYIYLHRAWKKVCDATEVPASGVGSSEVS